VVADVKRARTRGFRLTMMSWLNRTRRQRRKFWILGSDGYFDWLHARHR